MNLKSTKVKYVLGIIGAIIIGAIGSGIWEMLLEPFFTLASENIINGISHLSSSLEDSLYKSIARGYSEEMSYFAVSLILFILSGFLGVISYDFVFKHKKGNFYKTIESEIENVENIENPKEKIIELKSRLESRSIRLRKIGYILFSFVVLIYFFLVGQSVIIKYKTERITDFRQTLSIVKPYVSNHKYDQFTSLFSRINTRKDYDIIMDSLYSICNKNDIKIK